MSEAKAVTIQILGKDYLVSCSDEEKSDLLESADYLNSKMLEIRDSGKVVGTDRVAVMAALNIAHELLHQDTASSSGISPNFSEIESQISSIQSKIEAVLSEDRQLELEA